MLAVRSTKMSIVKSENPLEPPANSLGSRRLHKGRIGWHAGTKPKFNEEFYYLGFFIPKKKTSEDPKKGRVEDSGSGSADSFGYFCRVQGRMLPSKYDSLSCGFQPLSSLT